ncbi:hypothetical protein D9M72_653050 [compost metagenome]
MVRVVFGAELEVGNSLHEGAAVIGSAFRDQLLDIGAGLGRPPGQGFFLEHVTAVGYRADADIFVVRVRLGQRFQQGINR